MDAARCPSISPRASAAFASAIAANNTASFTCRDTSMTDFNRCRFVSNLAFASSRFPFNTTYAPPNAATASATGPRTPTKPAPLRPTASNPPKVSASAVAASWASGDTKPNAPANPDMTDDESPALSVSPCSLSPKFRTLFAAGFAALPVPPIASGSLPTLSSVFAAVFPKPSNPLRASLLTPWTASDKLSRFEPTFFSSEFRSAESPVILICTLRSALLIIRSPLFALPSLSFYLIGRALLWLPASLCALAFQSLSGDRLLVRSVLGVATYRTNPDHGARSALWQGSFDRLIRFRFGKILGLFYLLFSRDHFEQFRDQRAAGFVYARHGHAKRKQPIQHRATVANRIGCCEVIPRRLFAFVAG